MNTNTAAAATAAAASSLTGTGGEVLPQDLALLQDLEDFKVAEHDLDPRGYTVVGADNEVIGKIEDLVVSPGMIKAFFALVRTGDWLNDAYLMIPMKPIRLEPDNSRAYVPFTREQCRLAPTHAPGLADYDRHERYWSSSTAL